LGGDNSGETGGGGDKVGRMEENQVDQNRPRAEIKTTPLKKALIGGARPRDVTGVMV